jgi:hypothetical protein
MPEDFEPPIENPDPPVEDPLDQLIDRLQAEADDQRVEEREPEPVSDQDYYPHGTPFDDDGNLNPGWSFDENNNPVFVGPDFIEPTIDTPVSDPSYYPNGLPYDDDGNLNPGWTLDENNNPVFVGGDFVEPATLDLAAAARQYNTLQVARTQAALRDQRKQANDGDWRVRLRLAPEATYLYRADDGKGTNAGILQPLAVTDGVVFPYTPQINTVYSANYSAYDLTHSNFRGQFYQNSHVDNVNITATFTAQDSNEAAYMLAVIHFFRSVTKMFYGQDAERGAPPPLVFLEGLGEYQYNLHPCVVSQFTYNLPNDVDYIRAGSPNINGTDLLQRRAKQDLPTNIFSSVLNRLASVGLKKGALTAASASPAPPSLSLNSPTYVPTRIEIQLTLLPMQSRSQVSKQFSLKGFANGNLLKGGFW